VIDPTQPSIERCRSTSSSGRLAGDATTVAAANVVAIVGIEREMPPTRGSIARAERLAQRSARIVATTAKAIDVTNLSSRDRASSPSASSNTVRAAQYASLIVVMRPTRSASVACLGSGRWASVPTGRWSTTSVGSTAPRSG